MLAIAIREPGGPEVLVPVERPLPEPGPGELRIRVSHAGVNRPDILQRRGGYPPPAGASDLPGLEVAGVVDALGAGTSRWRIGDAVCALLPGGGYAQSAVADAGACLPVPPSLPPAEAAALPETVFTVWANVFERGRLAPGETLLVHGGAGGIGMTATILGKLFGARVLATAGGAAKTAFCRRLGADAAIDYRAEDFAARVAELTGGKGADVILDIVGAPYMEKNLRALAHGGRLVVLAMLGGHAAAVDLRQVLTRHLTITASTLRPRPRAEKARLAREVERHVWPFVASGRVRPVIDRVLPLGAAAEAHRLMEASAHAGKIVLAV
jgi:putative PIG3 family NAD(P)H quinone oxidoreductase